MVGVAGRVRRRRVGAQHSIVEYGRLVFPARALVPDEVARGVTLVAASSRTSRHAPGVC